MILQTTLELTLPGVVFISATAGQLLLMVFASGRFVQGSKTNEKTSAMLQEAMQAITTQVQGLDTRLTVVEALDRQRGYRIS